MDVVGVKINVIDVLATPQSADILFTISSGGILSTSSTMDVEEDLSL